MSVAQASKRLTAAKQQIYLAECENDAAEREWKSAVAAYAKADVADLDFSNVSCAGNRHSGHVYKHKGPGRSRGGGHYVCVFCNCDDWSE